jgi:hypothetical protein
MSNSISLQARQRFRQQLQNVEYADEIVDSLNEYLSRFVPFSGNFSSSSWNTIYEYQTTNNCTVMVTYSIIAKESISKQAGFKRTAVFYNENNIVQGVNLTQSDYTNKTQGEFDVRLTTINNKILVQVKGATNNPTKWNGSLQIEKLDT